MRRAIKKHTARNEKGHRMILTSLEQASSFENVGKDGTDKAVKGKKISRNFPMFA